MLPELITLLELLICQVLRNLPNVILLQLSIVPNELLAGDEPLKLLHLPVCAPINLLVNDSLPSNLFEDVQEGLTDLPLNLIPPALSQQLLY